RHSSGREREPALFGHGERPKPSSLAGKRSPGTHAPLALTFLSRSASVLKTIVSPQVLPYTWRTKFSTLIRDVATTETPDLVFSIQITSLLGIDLSSGSRGDVTRSKIATVV